MVGKRGLTDLIGDAISRGLLPPIDGWWKISSVPPKRVTVDAGREAQQNRADVERGKPCERRSSLCRRHKLA